MAKIINALWDKLSEALSWVILLLPESPFKAISNSEVSQYMSSLNWIFPISEMIAILQAWTTAIAVFYLYQAILRWVKAIE